MRFVRHGRNMVSIRLPRVERMFFLDQKTIQERRGAARFARVGDSIIVGSRKGFAG